MRGKSEPVPSWVWDMVNAVAEQHGIDRRPIIKWSRIKHGTGGWAQSHKLGNTISIRTDYQNPQRMRLVVLHELAHWLLPERHGHDQVFWEKAMDLYYQYAIPEDTVRGEFFYREGSKRAFNQSQYVLRDGVKAAATNPRNRPKGCYCLCHFKPIEW